MDRIRSIPLLLPFATVACDPGADYHVEGAPDGRVTWRQGADSVVARVYANAFTINLTTAVEVIASNAAHLEFDSSSVSIHARDGTPVVVERYRDTCYYASSDSLKLRCATAIANLHSTNYRQLDGMTVQFGYAVLDGRRIPLTTVFRQGQ